MKVGFKPDCVLCGMEVHEHVQPSGTVWGNGHNAQPLAEGRCCDSCNRLVIAARLGALPEADADTLRLAAAIGRHDYDAKKEAQQ